MSGTKIGGIKAATTNKQRHGADFYRRIALLAQAKWYENGCKPRGFAVNTQLASIVGRKGGLVSRKRYL